MPQAALLFSHISKPNNIRWIVKLMNLVITKPSLPPLTSALSYVKIFSVLCHDTSLSMFFPYAYTHIKEDRQKFVSSIVSAFGTVKRQKILNSITAKHKTMSICF
jgi:uncharacterized protein YhhL (DUF1145 family)